MSAPTAPKKISVTIDAKGNPSPDPVPLSHGETAEWSTASGMTFDLAWEKTPTWESDAVASKTWGNPKSSHRLVRHAKAFKDAPKKAKYTITLYDAAGKVAVVKDPDLIMDT